MNTKVKVGDRYRLAWGGDVPCVAVEGVTCINIGMPFNDQCFTASASEKPHKRLVVLARDFNKTNQVEFLIGIESESERSVVDDDEGNQERRAFSRINPTAVRINTVIKDKRVIITAHKPSDNGKISESVVLLDVDVAFFHTLGGAGIGIASKSPA